MKVTGMALSDADIERAVTEGLEVQGEELETMLYRQAGADLLVYRAEDGEAGIVSGRVVPYNEWTEVDSFVEGHFLERFAPGALTKTFAEQSGKLKGYFEHGRSRMFDRMPIMSINRAWDADDGGYFEANILPSVPDILRDGLRRGIYGASIGARVIKRSVTKRPSRSDHNPEGLEERTYTEVRAHDISLTPSPQYATQVMMRSIADDLLVEKLLEDPTRLRELIIARAETEEVSDPEHSVREEPEDQAPERSRPSQPVRDYLADEEEKTWRL